MLMRKKPLMSNVVKIKAEVSSTNVNRDSYLSNDRHEVDKRNDCDDDNDNNVYENI